MAINYFEKEVEKFRKSFNRCFGNRAVFNIELRQAALMSILWLGVLAERIDKRKDKEVIMEFYNLRKSLKRAFEYFERMERRISDGETERGASYKSRRGCSVQQLRQRVRV